MNIKGQLTKLFAVLTMSGMLYSASVVVSPSTLPIGAAVNVGGDNSVDHYYVQSLRITFQNNGAGAWAANEDVVVNFPASIGLADVDMDGDYDDEISVVVTAAAALAVTVQTATANSITINITNGAADKPANAEFLYITSSDSFIACLK